MVSAQEATRSAPIDSPPQAPMTMTSSPSATPGTSVTSTVVRSMLIRPAIGARRPRTRTNPRFDARRGRPSSYPRASEATRVVREATKVRPYPRLLPAGTSFMNMMRLFSARTGFTGSGVTCGDGG